MTELFERWRGKPLSGGTIAVIEPATGEVLGEVGRASAEDVRSACSAAREAQRGWPLLPPAERAAIFRRAAAFLEANAEAVRERLVRETGSVPAKAAVELKVAVGELHEAAAMATQPRGVVLPCEPGVTSLARRVPHGVAGVISPFNFPLILSMRAAAPALAAGNAVVLKPDPRTPVAGGVMIAAAFEEAGLPEGLLHVLPGGGEVGEALVADADVAMVSFTGSTATGRKIAELAARHLKKVSLELGGKNSLIVLDDVDLDRAVAAAAWGAFLHQGQICMSTGRVLVTSKLARAFVDALADKARKLPVGDPHREPVALGPLIDSRQAERVAGVVSDSIAAGARLRAGGEARGVFFPPTVLDEVGPGMRAFEEEIFGPVAPVTVYEDDDEAVRLANATDYGLSVGIVTGSSARGLEVAARLKAGIVHVNDQTVADEPWAPFGGGGATGGGRHGGPANWETFSQWQWLTLRGEAPLYPF